MNRSRWVKRISVDAGQPVEIINQLWTPPWNSTLIQFSISYSQVVVGVGDFQIFKRSIAGSVFDVLIYSDAPNVDQKTDELVLCEFELVKGDAINVLYGNPDGIAIGVEAIFREGQ